MFEMKIIGLFYIHKIYITCNEYLQFIAKVFLESPNFLTPNYLTPLSIFKMKSVYRDNNGLVWTVKHKFILTNCTKSKIKSERFCLRSQLFWRESQTQDIGTIRFYDGSIR